jgi:hypothetical protein
MSDTTSPWSYLFLLSSSDRRYKEVLKFRSIWNDLAER